MMFGQWLNTHRNSEVTSKGSDQAVRMHRLVLAFAGRIYHLVGNLMSRLIVFCYRNKLPLVVRKMIMGVMLIC